MSLRKCLKILEYSKALAKHLTMEMWSPGPWSQFAATGVRGKHGTSGPIAS